MDRMFFEILLLEGEKNGKQPKYSREEIWASLVDWW